MGHVLSVVFTEIATKKTNEKNIEPRFPIKRTLCILFKPSVVRQTSPLRTDYILIIYCKIKQVVLNDTERSKE